MLRFAPIGILTIANGKKPPLQGIPLRGILKKTKL
jgi:hypothetical protein